MLPIVAIIIGFALDILAGTSYFLSESKSITAWIPSFIGLPMLIAGALALNSARQKTVMRVATTFAALGLLASAGRLAGVVAKGAFAWNLGSISLVAMAALCSIYLLLSMTLSKSVKNNR